MSTSKVDFICESAGITYSELARKLNVSRSAITQWKRRGSIPPVPARKISQITGIPPYVINEIFPKPFEPEGKD